ncbi:hypothetical protein GGI21_000368 [Coemansia aciculifera]|nr:hypothetical protein GGI21_000368 [Coemansia aciculifera]
MPFLSVFQLLPEHIVKLIVRYVDNEPNSYRNKVYHRKRPRQQSQRQPQLHEPLFYNEYTTGRLATKLNIYVELDLIYTGKALEVLSRAPYEDGVFQAAREISFKFSLGHCETDEVDSAEGGSAEDVDDPVVQGNMIAFVQRLTQLAPRVRECHLDDDFPPQISKVDDRRLNFLTKLILVDTSSYVCKLGNDWLDVHLDYDSVCNLTHIDYRLNTTAWLCLKLLRHDYEFGDDTLFRGNATTLESLHMRMNKGTATVLKERRVFTHDSHPRLRSVALYGSVNSTPRTFATRAAYLQFLLSIGSAATARAFYDVSFEQDIPCVLQLLGEYSSIRALSFQETCFTYLDAIALIKSLPQLSDLCLAIPERGAQLADIPTSQLFDVLIEAHAPIGKQLRRFLVQGCQASVEELVEFSVLLTSLCPSLCFVDFLQCGHGSIGKHMRECADLPPLQKYEQVVQRMQIPEVPMYTILDWSMEEEDGGWNGGIQ